MFGVSSARRWVSVMLLGLLAMTFVVLSGCGEKEAVDPYVYDSLRRVTRGDTLSTNFLFEIDAPEFDYVRGNTALVRDGNLLEFLVGEDLEHNYRNLSGTLLGVRKTFSPAPTHLVIQRIKRGGVVEADSLPVPPHYTLPTLLRAGAVDLETPGAPLPDLGWKTKDLKEARATYLPEEEGDDLKPIQTGIETFVYMPRHDLADSVKANPSAEDFAWYAVFAESSVEITELTDGAEWMLHLLLAKDLPLIGSFSMLSIEDEYKKRKIEHETLGHVVGTMKINWFKFGNTFVEGAERDI
ncbi:MAG: hypothetical protein KAH56_01520 [Candidatus Krumholzibacteria bacterium]|nr:hypothetical protein [Candidatus Krumholzibacteria bacterium]